MQGETCQGTRKDGTPCQQPARPSGYCFAHDPELRQARREGSVKGGQNKHRMNRLRRLMPADLGEVFDQLRGGMGEVHDGDLDPRAAQAMASLAGAMCKVLELGELAQRVADLEQSVQSGRKGY